MSLSLINFRSEIWFDDVDLEDIENATGKKIEMEQVINESTLLPQINAVGKKTEEIRYEQCFHLLEKCFLRQEIFTIMSYFELL